MRVLDVWQRHHLAEGVRPAALAVVEMVCERMDFGSFVSVGAKRIAIGEPWIGVSVSVNDDEMRISSLVGPMTWIWICVVWWGCAVVIGSVRSMVSCDDGVFVGLPIAWVVVRVIVFDRGCDWVSACFAMAIDAGDWVNASIGKPIDDGDWANGIVFVVIVGSMVTSCAQPIVAWYLVWA